jgi:hypothetical protein
MMACRGLTPASGKTPWLRWGFLETPCLAAARLTRGPLYLSMIDIIQ